MTVAFFAALETGRQELIEKWAAGEFLDLSLNATLIENARAVARCETIKAAQDMSYEEMVGTLNDDEEHIGAEAPGPSGFGPAG